MLSKSVPFYANTADNTHCFQASIRCVLKYFAPQKDFDWDELERLSAKVPDLPTWPQAMLLNLIKMGFKIKVIEGFDANDFVLNGKKYLIRAFGKETSDWQIQNSDIAQEQKYYKELLDSDADIKIAIPTIQDIIKLLNKGYLVQTTVNSKKLNGKEGYVGHSVLIFDYDDNGLYMHDPGLPPQENRYVPIDLYEAAWAYPNDNAKNIIAIKLGKGGFNNV